MFGVHQQVDPSSACTTLYNFVLPASEWSLPTATHSRTPLLPDLGSYPQTRWTEIHIEIQVDEFFSSIEI